MEDPSMVIARSTDQTRAAVAAPLGIGLRRSNLTALLSMADRIARA